MVAWQGGAKQNLPPGTAVSLPFTGPGWQDNVLLHEGYVAPPRELADAVLAPREMNVTLGNPSPDKKWFLDEINDGPTPMSIFGRPFDELGGLFIDNKANRNRTLSNINVTGIQIISATDGSHKIVATPPNTRVTGARWTPDGTGVAYMTLGDDATHIWITDLATNKPRQITKTTLLPTRVTNFYWINGGKQIAAVFPPDGRPSRPQPPPVPAGPEVRTHMSTEKERNRTFPSLMSTPYDLALLKWHSNGQIALVDVATGAATKFGTPQMITAFDMSPDGKYARVTRMIDPLSYIVPTSSFGSIEEVRDATGAVLAKLSDRPINLGATADVVDPLAPPPDPAAAPAGGGGRGGAANDNGKRELSWRADGQGFTYLQLEPAPAAPAGAGGRNGGRNGGGAGQGGAAGAPGAAAAQGANGRGAGNVTQGPPRKDRLMQWLPPFNDTSMKQLYENPTRMTGARFSPDSSIVFFTEGNATKAVYLADTATVYTVLAGGGGNRGGNGGAPAAPADPAAPAPPAAGNANPGGSLLGVGGAGGGGGRGGGGGGGGGRGGGGGPTTPVLLSPDGSSVYVEGTSGGGGRAGTAAAIAFLDKINVKTGVRTNLFRGEPGNPPDRISIVLDPEAKKLVLSKQNSTTAPQQYLYDNGARKQLTTNEELFPDLARMNVKVYDVARADGFSFKTIVYLPSNYKEGTRLPAIFWFYPYEYTSQDAYNTARNGGEAPAANPTGDTYQNFGPRSMQFFTRLGYAVIDNHAPIVGPQGQMNNNYVNDLRNDLAATIDELDRQGIIDRQKLAIGGHSYGAFSTVNAMVNTPYFKAGIAGDGAYNRTLTPNGFQSERRDLWEAPNVYLDMSPFLKADHLNGALLMYHGMHDQNVGTDPINSLRLFHALTGLGKTTALYRYPFEDHGPAARETLLDLWSRWAAWLDKYVKNPAPETKPKPASAARGGGGGQ
jgi:dipeptidyl aminopeptidase/acylaminoacyl peptidase